MVLENELKVLAQKVSVAFARQSINAARQDIETLTIHYRY